jgi:type VI secretion system protein ImpG
MSDQLLPYYHRELAFIRRLGGEFARQHPESAAGLELGPDTCADPHVERLIMAFAYLTARIRRKLDDDFPEIPNALLGVLYPHYQAPIPSMAIIQFQLDRGQGSLTKGYPIERGSPVETQPIEGEPCRFRTCYPVRVWPMEVTRASLGDISSDAPILPRDATAILRIGLKCFVKDMTFAKLQLEPEPEPDSASDPESRPERSMLRFYLKGQPQHVNLLYEVLFNNRLEVTVANAGDPSPPIRLGPECVKPVGFEEDEGMLPYSSRSFLGYRLLTEYFTFPEKFRFLDVTGLTPKVRSGLGNEIEICFYLDRTSSDLEKNIDKDTFRLGCTPVVNLFEKQADPIALTHHDSEYRVVPDARRPLGTEVYSVDRVTGTSPGGEEVEYQPFYSFKHAAPRSEMQSFWYATRKPSVKSVDRVDHGTEVCLSLVDLDFKTGTKPDRTVDVATTCLNRDLPNQLPFGGGQPVLHLTGGGPFSKVACLTKPTRTLRPDLGEGAMWRLISHLSLNHLSIADREKNPEALREILKLYDFADSAETRAKINSILHVGSERVVGRVRDEQHTGFCRGVKVDIEIDEERFSDNGLYIFASILERFLGLYCSINSFSQLSISTKKSQEALCEWAPRTGDRVLL